MTRDGSIIEMAQWWRSPPGRYLLGWEQALLDHLVTDVFGFHALQLGLPQLNALRANRMPHRWLACDSLAPIEPVCLPPIDEALSPLMPMANGAALHCEFDALPFPNQSLDLVVLPHALELARDPHDTLREVERVLVPEGRLVIVGLNPTSLWGLRQRWGHARQRVGLGGGLLLPDAGEFIGYRRARDWLRLLGFEVERGRFGCWRPPLESTRWLDRYAWMDRAGARIWPVLGAAYVVEAVKRVRGMRLVGLVRRREAGRATAPTVVANRQREAVWQPARERPQAAAKARHRLLAGDESTWRGPTLTHQISEAEVVTTNRRRVGEPPSVPRQRPAARALSSAESEES